MTYAHIIQTKQKLCLKFTFKEFIAVLIEHFPFKKLYIKMGAKIHSEEKK